MVLARVDLHRVDHGIQTNWAIVVVVVVAAVVVVVFVPPLHMWAGHKICPEGADLESWLPHHCEIDDYHILFCFYKCDIPAAHRAMFRMLTDPALNATQAETVLARVDLRRVVHGIQANGAIHFYLRS